MRMIIILLFAAVPGTTILMAAVLRFVSTSSGGAMLSTPLSGFASVALLPGLLNPSALFSLFILRRRKADRLLAFSF